MKPTHKNEHKDKYTELEHQFILRLPIQAAQILKTLTKVGVSLRNRLTITVQDDMRHVEVQLDNWLFHGTIYDLPTITESLKTIDKKMFFKTADICQIMICTDGFTDEKINVETSKVNCSKKFLLPHGYTQPLKNIGKQRFRKTLPKEYVDQLEIDKEVKILLRADSDAIDVNWEVLYENMQKKIIVTKSHKKTTEEQIFGAAISDSSEIVTSEDEIKVDI